jgi:hypothetical protein
MDSPPWCSIHALFCFALCPKRVAGFARAAGNKSSTGGSRATLPDRFMSVVRLSLAARPQSLCAKAS